MERLVRSLMILPRFLKLTGDRRFRTQRLAVGPKQPRPPSNFITSGPVHRPADWLPAWRWPVQY